MIKLHKFRYSIGHILIFLAALGVFSCSERKYKPTVGDLQSGEIAAQESRDAEIYFTQFGKLDAVLYADRILQYDLKKETLIEKMKVDFYNAEEIKNTTLNAKRGKVNDATKDMHAYDSVVVVNDSSLTVLQTEELMWRNKDKKIVSDKFVVITNPRERIEGYGFESDQTLKNYVIFNITYITSAKSAKQP